MKFRTRVAMVLLLAAISVDASAMEFIGVRSCGAWIEHRTDRNTAIVDEAWLVGFLSGLADGLNKDFLQGTDNASLTDLCRYEQDAPVAVAAALNERPRKALGWKTHAEAMRTHLSSLAQSGVASTG